MPRTAEANQLLKDARREAILAAARKVFAANGVGATRVSDIAAEARISQGLVYHYFPNKEALFPFARSAASGACVERIAQAGHPRSASPRCVQPRRTGDSFRGRPRRPRRCPRRARGVERQARLSPGALRPWPETAPGPSPARFPTVFATIGRVQIFPQI